MLVHGQSLVPRSHGDGKTWCRGPLLGKGGYGSVYLGILKPSRFCQKSRNFSLPTYMAVKSAEISDSSSLREEKEVLVSLVGCPNVIQYLGEETTVGWDGSTAYNLLLEYGSGGSLYDRIYRSGYDGLPEAEVRWYTKSILEGLVYIHEAGYVHCDLKPENILLVPRTRNGRTEIMSKICDFGLAKRASEHHGRKKSRQSWRGTPMYLSPEAVRDGVQEWPSDIWALGCIVLEMLTRWRPWHVEVEERGDIEMAILKKIGKSTAVPSIPKALSSEARSFLGHCLKRMPGNRLSAKALLQLPFVNVDWRD